MNGYKRGVVDALDTHESLDEERLCKAEINMHDAHHRNAHEN